MSIWTAASDLDWYFGGAACGWPDEDHEDPGDDDCALGACGEHCPYCDKQPITIDDLPPPTEAEATERAG